MHSHPSIFIHLKFLFNMIYRHGFVPNDFGKGIIFPLVKDVMQNVNSADNYRAITVSPLVSKLFEYCILNRFEYLLTSDDLQFGFKRNSSCSHAIFLLSQTIDYFINHGSNVYMASLDARKAFDRINHVKLFNIMLDRGLPARFVKLIFDWYSKLSAAVKWNNVLSSFFLIKSGVRQGGILSPILFNLYADVMLQSLNKSDLGCHLGSIYVGYIAYADDIILLSASICDLQSMINICFTEGAKLDIIFNASKSCLFKVGKVFNDNLMSLKLGSQSLCWMNKLKYLGLYFISSKSLKVDISNCIRKCYSSANAIFKQSKHVSEPVKLNLLEAYVLPILTYATEAVPLSNGQCNDLNICWNNIYRKIFGINKWESVKQLQFFSERLDFIRLYHLRKLRFIQKAFNSDNHNLSHCITCFQHSNEFRSLCNEYDLSINLNGVNVHAKIRDNFEELCFGVKT